MFAATFAMTITGLNEWRINLKPNAATQATATNDHVCLLSDTNVLGLGKKPERFLAAFAADTTLFHSASSPIQFRC